MRSGDPGASPDRRSGCAALGIDGQAMESGIESVRVTQARKVVPGSDERLLDRVARELRVPENQASCRVQPREMHIDEAREGVMIALPRSLDESSLVHGPLAMCGTPMVGVLDRIWRSRLGKGSSACEVVLRLLPAERQDGEPGRGKAPAGE